MYFSHILEINVRPVSLAVLGLTVWVIYTIDHLLDARSLKVPATTVRHKFHQDHFKVLAIASVLVAAVCGLLLVFLRTKIFMWGLGLLALVVVYMFSNKFLKYVKELIAALLYTVGVLLPNLSQLDFSMVLSQQNFIVFFFLVALTNLVLFSWFEVDADRVHNSSSIAVHLGESRTKALVIFLFLAQLFIIILKFYSDNDIVTLFLMLSVSSGLVIIFLAPNFFRQHDRYRLIGDAVFLLPGIALLI